MAVALASYPWLPLHVQESVVVVTLAVAAAAAWTGVSHPPAARLVFRRIGIGFGLWGLVATAVVAQNWGSPEAVGAHVQLATIPGYGFLIAALVGSVGDHRAGRAAWELGLDSMVVTVSIGFVAWKIMIEPALSRVDGSQAGSAVAGLLLDLVLAYLISRALFAGRTRNGAVVLLAAGVYLLVPTDAWVAMSPSPGRVSLAHPAVALWLTSFALIGASARHPVAGEIVQRSTGRLSPLFWIVGVSLSVAAMGVAELAERHRSAADRWDYVLATLVVTGLLTIRISMLFARLRQRIATDPLTRLVSRQAILDWLDSRMSDPAPFAVLYVDLDDFKKINDTFGHHMGDVILEETGRRLTALTRPPDLAGRIGGDEFVVVAEGVGDELTACAIRDRISAALARPCVVGDRSVELSASVGFAVAARTRPATFEQLLREADRSMYAEKPTPSVADRARYGPAVGRRDLIADALRPRRS